MVLGDTSLQDTAQQELFIDTGLSHLSAVSGANVAIVLTAFFLLCRWVGLGPRVQVISAGVALLGFVVLVGTEPSVLRAGVAGVVGLLAVVNSSRAEPIHSLCIGIIGLIVWDSNMAELRLCALVRGHGIYRGADSHVAPRSCAAEVAGYFIPRTGRRDCR